MLKSRDGNEWKIWYLTYLMKKILSSSTYGTFSPFLWYFSSPDWATNALSSLKFFLVLKFYNCFSQLLSSHLLFGVSIRIFWNSVTVLSTVITWWGFPLSIFQETIIAPNVTFTNIPKKLRYIDRFCTEHECSIL